MKPALYLLPVILFLVLSGCGDEVDTRTHQNALRDVPNPASLGVTVPNAVVVSGHRQASEIGRRILKERGNAVDAFVATTFAEYVLAAGYTSLSGPLSAIIYDGQNTYYLDGSYRMPANPAGDGQAKLFIHGAPRALHDAHRAFGKLSWSAVLEPARQLAVQGFTVDYVYSLILQGAKSKLCRTATGRARYFQPAAPSLADEQDCLAWGVTLPEGAAIVLPEFAETIRGLQQQGGDYMYCRWYWWFGWYLSCGDWADRFLAHGQSIRGTLTANDLADYRAEWHWPHRVSFDQYEVATASGHSQGGAEVAVSVRVLELARTDPAVSADIRNWGHFNLSPDSLELLVRLNAKADFLSWSDDPDVLTSRWMTDAYIESSAASIWSSLKNECVCLGGKGGPVEGTSPGSHSSANVIIDENGWTVASINTINDSPFGIGDFVGGIPLNDSAPANQGAYPLGPSDRVPFPGAPTLLFDRSRQPEPLQATAVFNSGLKPATLQMLVNQIGKQEYGISNQDIIDLPRFGFFLPIFAGTTYVPPEFPQAAWQEVQTRGVAFYLDSILCGLLPCDEGFAILGIRDRRARRVFGSPDWRQHGDPAAVGY